jgi:hypothetical protein
VALSVPWSKFVQSICANVYSNVLATSEPKAHLQQCFMCSALGPAVSADLSVCPARRCLHCALVKLYTANQMIPWHVVFCQLCGYSCSQPSCTIAQCQGSHVYHCSLIGCSPCISSPCAAHLMYHTCKLVHSGCWIKHSASWSVSVIPKCSNVHISCFACLYAFNFNLFPHLYGIYWRSGVPDSGSATIGRELN